MRTRGPASARQHRIIFGSCRYAKVVVPKQARQLGIDALDAYAARMARRPPQEWPDALLLLGDQVYADELTPQNRRRIAGRRDRHPDWPDDEIVSYDEYVGLYRDSWADPEVRWLMSCVPTAMIFDDHDVHDDWNTSQAWRQQMAQRPWWRERIRAALASYWVYQHLGNLPAEELAADPDYHRILDAEGDTWPLLVELADRADAEVDGSKGLRFSFRWDLGTSRFIMIDSRNGRILDDGRHLMLGDREFGWVEEQMRDGAVDHLVLGTSLPWLLPHALGDLQAVNQIAANRSGWRGWLAEKIRQGADLEHWQAFHDSFDRLTRLIARVATGDPGERPPATVSVLPGDVHHSYAARVDLPGITSNGTDGGCPGPPADLLPRPQQGPLVHQARFPGGLVPPPRPPHRVVEQACRSDASSRHVDQARRAAVRQHDRHTRARRPPRHGLVRTAPHRGVADRTRPTHTHPATRPGRSRPRAPSPGTNRPRRTGEVR